MLLVSHPSLSLPPSGPQTPSCYTTRAVHGFVEELVVNDDPEYKVRGTCHTLEMVWHFFIGGREGEMGVGGGMGVWGEGWGWGREGWGWGEGGMGVGGRDGDGGGMGVGGGREGWGWGEGGRDGVEVGGGGRDGRTK